MRAGFCDRLVRAHGAQLKAHVGIEENTVQMQAGRGETVTALDCQQLEEEDPSSGAVKGV